MRKRILFALLALALLLPTASAQQRILTGRVENVKSHTPVEFASAVLLRPDSSVVRGTMTDSVGSFTLGVPGEGSYILKVSFVGYNTLLKNFSVASSAPDTLSLGTLAFESADNQLRTATVVGVAARVEQKEDTTVFNASAYRVPEGSTLEALVKQLPGVEVSDDGTIKWNGKEVKELLINGKDFFKGDTKIAMKNLPTDMVSRIKAYDKQSDYAELTGIDDGEETTVLDITTKRQLNESWVANVDLGYGTHDRYTGKVFATRFTDYSRVTAFGSANNTGDRGFGGPRGFGGGQGLVANKEAGLDFSWENGKDKKENGRLELGGNVRYSHTGTDLIKTSASETFLNTGSTSSFSNSHSISGSSSTSVSGAFRVRWSPDTLTSITFRPSFTHSDGHNSGDSRTATFNDDPYAIDEMRSPLDSIFLDNPTADLLGIAVNRTGRLSLGDSKSNGANASLNVMRRLSANGRNVSLRAQVGYTKSESNAFSISDIKYYNGKDPQFLNQYSKTPAENWNYNIRVGYVEPIVKNLFAEVRYQYSYKYSNSDRSRYNLDSLYYAPYAQLWPEYANFGNPDAYPMIGSLPTEADVLMAVRDLNNSQYATYKYYDHTVTLGIRYNTEAIRFNAGVDFNPEKTRLAYLREGQGIDTVVTRRVFNVAPQVRFRYRFSKTSNIDFRYRGSSSQPSMTNLLEVVDDSDPLNVTMGNPGLKPSWTNTLRAMYYGYNPDRQRGIMGALQFQQTRNSVSNLMVYDENTGVRYTRPENINGNWSGNGHFMFNTAMGAQKLFNVSTFTNFSYNNAVGYVSNMNSAAAAAPLLAVSRIAGDTRSYDFYNNIFASANPAKSTTRTLGIGEKLDLTYRASWFDVGLLGSLNYQHSRSTLQSNNNMDTWNFAYGASANFTFTWGMSLSTDIRMNARRGYSDAAMNTNEVLWNAQLSQSFLKNKAATISLQFYDILQQQDNVSRTINAMMRSDSWTNGINSYCMVHFIYKLNIFKGGKSAAPSENSGRGSDRPGQMMPPPGHGGMGPGGMGPGGGGMRGGF